MVTNNIYPNMFLGNVRKYNIKPDNPLAKPNNTPVDPDAPSNKNAAQTEELENNRCISKFLSNEAQEINVSDIIKDFKATMTAIGVPRSIGNTIVAQLREVQAQTTAENPSISKIQSGLCSAAESLDGFIAQTLGKPSNVVKQWMDALLIQKVNYKSSDPVSTNNVQVSAGQQTVSTPPPSMNLQLPATTGSTEINNQQSFIQKSFEINNQQNPTTPQEIKKAEVNAAFNLQVEKNVLPATTNSPETSNETTDSDNSLFKESREMFKKASQMLFKGNQDKAIKLYKDTITVAKDLGDDQTQMDSYVSLAKIYDQKNDLKTSLSNYNDALKIASTRNDKENLAKIHYDIGSIYDDLNMAPQALKHYQASLSFDGEIDNIEGQTLTLNNVGSLYASTNKTDEAMDHYRVAYALASQTNNSQAKGHILSNMGSIYHDLNDNRNAIEYYRRALKADQDCNNLSGYSQTLLSLADVYEDCNQPERAMKCYNKAFENAQQLNDKNLTAYLYNVMNSRN